MKKNKITLRKIKEDISYYIKKKKGATNMQRFMDILSDPSNKYINRVDDAGKIINKNIIMHNGLKISQDSYYDSFVDIFKLNQGVHEPQEERMFMEVLKHVPENGTIIELGSYWAFYSMWFNKEIKNANCYMIEADSEALEIGKNNFKINNMTGKFFSGFIKKGEIEIDNFIEKENIDSVDILHSDIQGYELEMLKTCKKAIAEKKIKYFFISTHGQELHYDCLNYLESNGYEIIASADFNEETFCYDGVLVARLKKLNGVQPTNIGARKKTKRISPFKFFYLYLTRIILQKIKK